MKRFIEESGLRAELPKWKKKLTKKQLKHLKEMNITSLRSFLYTRAFQLKQNKEREEYGLFSDACYDCREIANRLDVTAVNAIKHSRGLNDTNNLHTHRVR